MITLAYLTAAAMAAGVLVLVFALLMRNCQLSAELAATEADRDRLDNCVRHNLRAIRSRVGYCSVEAVKVCDAIETTLQARCRADLEKLEREIVSHRRAHNAAILLTAQQPKREARP